MTGRHGVVPADERIAKVLSLNAAVPSRSKHPIACIDAVKVWSRPTTATQGVCTILFRLPSFSFRVLMRFRCFATGLFALMLLAACDRRAVVDNDGLTIDSVSGRARKTMRPTLPPLAPSAAVLLPDTAALRSPAPDTFNIVFETSQGDIDVAVARSWAPRGVDRLYYLTTHGFFDAMRFYKVQRDFIAQFGFSGDTRVTAVWDTMSLEDDAATQPNAAGTLAFASNGPNTRTTQLFFNLSDNSGLEQSGVAVVGRVVRGKDVLPRLYDVHGQGLGVDRIRKEGNAYLDRFTNLDYILRASVKR